ncbi:periplasmic binding protein/LacI transcriptional regulator [Candidatus Vecturithrix granuli]|uniref:Periplasmic binding protein/LacI transcriptional regulator n=1 Tax=Vecturithrix granuli TaxID=1499967 RepID=A0A081C917_VECG1|nr:periplasmic binding protein/LacI transcriptional regulator [Candidatus Vecturithrix granuli]
MLKKVVVMLLVVLCVVSINGFAQEKKLVIFSQCNFAEPYRAAQNKLMEELWAQVPDVEFQIFDGQADAARQISQIENAIRQEPDLLIVAPLQRDSLTKVMGEAIKAGIPTICLERDLVEPNWTTYIRCDNRKIGQMAGQFVVDYLTKKFGEPKGKLVEIQGMKGVEGAINRHAGFWDVIGQYPGIELVHDATANWFQPEAIDRMTEALNAVPEIDVVYAHNDPMAYGAFLAAKEKGREKEMIFIGIDGLDHEGKKYVKEGILALTVVYPLCVDKAVEIGKKMLEDPNFKPEPTYTMDSAIVTPETLK